MGGRPLEGTVRISGAKNASLPELCAGLLTDQTVQLSNVPEVRDHEPRTALVPPGDRYSIYRRLVPLAATHLRVGGVLALEVGRGMADEVAAICLAAGLPAQPPLRDLSGISRAVVARRPAG